MHRAKGKEPRFWILDFGLKWQRVLGIVHRAQRRGRRDSIVDFGFRILECGPAVVMAMSRQACGNRELRIDSLFQNGLSAAIPRTQNPEPRTQNPEPVTRNPEPVTRNPEPYDAET